MAKFNQIIGNAQYKYTYYKHKLRKPDIYHIDKKYIPSTLNFHFTSNKYLVTKNVQNYFTFTR